MHELWTVKQILQAHYLVVPIMVAESRIRAVAYIHFEGPLSHSQAH